MEILSDFFFGSQFMAEDKYANHAKNNKDVTENHKRELISKLKDRFQMAEQLNNEKKEKTMVSKYYKNNSCIAIRSNIAAISVVVVTAFFYRSPTIYLVNNI